MGRASCARSNNRLPVECLKLRWQNRPSGGQSNVSALQRRVHELKGLGYGELDVRSILVNEGYALKDIKAAQRGVKQLHRANGLLDWRSPTSINETARRIRNDIRSGRVAYAKGMRVLLNAYKRVQSLMGNRPDPRVRQLRQEINTTRRLLQKQYAPRERLMERRVLA